MATKKLPFNIRKHGNKYQFHGRIPTDLLDHPFFADNNSGFYYKSLGTSNLREAIIRRDEILATFETLREGSQGDKFNLWTKRYRAETKQFTKRHPDFEDPGEFKSIELMLLLEKLKKQHGTDKRIDEPKVIPEDTQIRIDALMGKKKSYKETIRYSLNKLIKEREARKGASGTAPKTLSKIKRGVEWFLEQIGERDIGLLDIDREQVAVIVNNMLDSGVAPKTLDGFLYGPRIVYDHIYENNPNKAHLNPFTRHKIPTSQATSYDLFTWDEIRELWLNAEDPDMKLAVQIGATTGARISEVTSLTTKHIKGFDGLCYAIKLNEKGKTEDASRVLPVHPKLADELGEGWKYPQKSKTLTTKFGKLRDKAITDWLNPLTEKQRKLSFHSFHVTVASYLVNDLGLTETLASMYTGHKPDKKGHSAIVGYLRTPDLKKKLEICQRLPWVFD